MDIRLGIGYIEVDFGAGGRVSGKGKSGECLEARREKCSIAIGAFCNDPRSDSVDLIEAKRRLNIRFTMMQECKSKRDIPQKTCSMAHP